MKPSKPTSMAPAAGPELLAAALDYAARGWSIIPTIGKKAAVSWKKYQNTPADEATLRRLFARRGVTGLAVILGKASGGMACRDYDDADAYKWWAAEHLDLASTLPTVRTPRGYHLYHRGPDRFADLEDGEYRGDSRHYCLLPPSLHPDGGTYCWTIPLPEGELPFVDPVEAGFLAHLPPETCVHAGKSTDHSPHPTHSLLVSEEDVEGAILATLPTGPGKRNRCLFELARRLKGFMPNTTPDTMESIVQNWYVRALPFITTKDWTDSWLDFRTAWSRITRPAGVTLAAIAAAAKVPADADVIVQMIAICRSMQAHHGPGRAWPLSCRVAGRMIGVCHDKAARVLKLLRLEGVIELVHPAGPKSSRRAAEYRLLEGTK